MSTPRSGPGTGICWLRVLAGILLLIGGAFAQSPKDALQEGFKHPPDSAKPRVWWHWLNGNVTEQGITADLEWMKRSGIAGMQMFDGNLGTPVFVDKRLVWMTPEWKSALRHAGAEADRLGLEMAMAASGGWSETAGPWVKPEQAMKKVVWSTTVVEGPRVFTGAVPQPPTMNGRFQNLPQPLRPEDLLRTPQGLPGAKPERPQVPPPPDPTFYRDIRVMAYRLPDGEVSMADAHPRITTNVQGAQTALLMDGDVGEPVSLEVPRGEDHTWIQFEFPEPYEAQAITIASAVWPILFGSAIPPGEVQYSHDGTNWWTLVSLPGPDAVIRGFPVQTYSFPEVAARFYRLVLHSPPPNPFMAMVAASLGSSLPVASSIRLTEVELSGPRVNHWQNKAAFGDAIEFRSIATPHVGESAAVSEIVDITASMRQDGTLQWSVPAGRWVILRLGYSLTGAKNHPATVEATGFEVDKLSADHVQAYVKTYTDMIADAVGPYFGKSFRYFLMDSWEAGVENWTDDMIAEFQRRRGYDPTPYLPVLTGRIVKSAEASDAFLWDFRRTIADLLAENHYREATRGFNEHGIDLYAEAMGIGAPTTGDGLLNKGGVNIPMGEFWTEANRDSMRPEVVADLRETASAAHIYGKRIAAAESFTTGPNGRVWASPYYLKPIGDKAFSLGINRIVFHTSDHQPFVDGQHKPGMTLGPFGQHYTRNTTWASQAIAWNTYLARCSYLLQQGHFVGDLAYFYGEGVPATVPYWKPVEPAPPEGYNLDWINADVLLTKMTVQDGRLVLPDGMSYRVLVLPAYLDQITLPVLRKIRDLVSEGATVVAPRPRHSPSLADFPQAAEYRSIVNQVWGSIDGMSAREHAYGKGWVYWGPPLDAVLAHLKVPPDLTYNRPKSDSRLVWIHRQDGDLDIYFVANQKERPEEIQVTFRMQSREPELWDPDTGLAESGDYTMADGRTTVPIRLAPYGSVFVVFRTATERVSRVMPRPSRTEVKTLSQPWLLSFPADRGAPLKITFDRLISWTDSTNAGVKYFSGTATYATEIVFSPSWFAPGTRVLLDLGEVKEIAEVSINGRSVGRILWKPPFEVDVTSALKPGSNHLEIAVTNLWPNRIIGDLQPNATRRYAWLDYLPFRADTPLLESGLLGPVKIYLVRPASSRDVSRPAEHGVNPTSCGLNR